MDICLYPPPPPPPQVVLPNTILPLLEVAMVALRLDSVTYYPLSAPGNPSPRFVPTITPTTVFR